MANDFSGDSDVVALYNFENGALITDSKNTNTLTNVNGVTADTVNYKQGLASALCDQTPESHLSIADSSLQSDFPLKSGTSNTIFSIVSWFRATIDDTGRMGITTKYETDSRRSFSLVVRDMDIELTIGYNNGDSFESLYLGTTNVIDANTWYNIKATYNNGAWALRVWNDTTQTIILNTSGTATNTISLEDVPWSIGSYRPTAGGNNFEGNIDETVFFKRIVSDADHDAIIAGTYAPAVTDIAILRRRMEGY